MLGRSTQLRRRNDVGADAERMRSQSSLSRRGVLLIVILSPALLGTEWKCAAVSNPTVVSARIDLIEPTTPRVGDMVQVTGRGEGTPPLQLAWDFGDNTFAAGTQAAHVYLAPGSYTITFTVRDAHGNINSDSSPVMVSARQSSSLLEVVQLRPDRVSGRGARRREAS
jgi:hypothetical protein